MGRIAIGDTVRVTHDIEALEVTSLDYATVEGLEGDDALLGFIHRHRHALDDGIQVRARVPLDELELWTRAPEGVPVARKAACRLGFHDDVRDYDTVAGNFGGALLEIGRLRHCTSCGRAIGY